MYHNGVEYIDGDSDEPDYAALLTERDERIAALEAELASVRAEYDSYSRRVSKCIEALARIIRHLPQPAANGVA